MSTIKFLRSTSNTPTTLNYGVPAYSITGGRYKFYIGDNSNTAQEITLASNIGNTPAGGISSTTVQAAINELDTEKLSLTGGTLSGSLILPTLITSQGASDYSSISANQWSLLGASADIDAVITPKGAGNAVVPGLRLTNGGSIKSSTSNNNTAIFQAYDVDGTAYKTFITLTSANTPSCAIAQPSGGTLSYTGGTIDNSVIGGTTPAAGTFSSLTTTASTSGGTVSQTISNTSNTSSSYSAQFIQVAGTTADDPYTQWSISGTRFYAMGIDNSDSDKVKLTTNTSACTPSSGTTLITVDSSGNQIVAGDIAINGGDITTSQTTASVFDTTATTVNAFRASTTLNMGYTGTSASTTNIATGAVATATTKTINIGSGGGAGDTLINIGSSQGNSLTYTYGTCIVGINGTGYVPTAQSLAGLGIVWNKSGGASTGATYFQNYKQLGSGGFYFELYDTANISPSLAATPLIIDGSGNALFSKKLSSNNALSGIGYSTGAGGTVTQSTSKSTGVTINKVCGKITMSNESLAGSGVVSFTMTNSAIEANDTILITHISGGSAGAYTITPQSAAGSAVIAIRNVSFSSLGEAIVLQFSCVKSVIS